MHRFLLLFFSLLLACSTIPQATGQIANDLKTIIADYEATGIELRDDNISGWPNLSPQRLQKEKEAWKKINKRLDAIDVSKLSSSDRINHDMLKLILDDQIFQLEFESHLFPLNAEGGFLAEMVYSIRGVQVNSETAYAKYVQRIKALPDYFAQRTAQMKEGQSKGKSSPKLIVQNCIDLIEHLLQTPAKETFFLYPVQDDPAQSESLEKLVETVVFPAYEQLQTFLSNQYLPQAPEQVGIAGITDGKAYYEQRVRYFTTYEISPQAIFETGQQEVKRIRAEMDAIISELNFQGSYADFLDFLRTDPQFYAPSGQALLHHAAWITKEMEGQLPKYFGKLPRMPLTVKPVPDAIATNYTSGRYSPGSYHSHKAGEYWVNTYKLKSRPLYVLPALSLHEGVPGHHLQIMLAAEIEDVPNFRKSTYISAYGEGWGLYSEYLGQEAGLYHTPYERFGRLTYEMWRACRLVVDPGMHYMGWTREQAMEFMASNTALSLHEVKTEIDRYIGWPGQAVSYKMGELKIRALRKKAELTLEHSFDIRAFHDKILEHGSVPLQTLERIIDEYLQEQLAKG